MVMKETRLKAGVIFCFLFMVMLLNAQNGVITLRNPSFEDTPKHSQIPREWIDCGFPGESEPDIHPSGDFGVTTKAQDGLTYLAMVTRDNSTWERISQQLSGPMQQGSCYGFSIYLAKSPEYLHKSRETGEEMNYIRNIKLRIYGGFSPCQREQLLAESPLINSNDWTQFNFKFQPSARYTYITFEAFYQTPNLFPYNGNLLLDHASGIAPIDCEKTDPQGFYANQFPTKEPAVVTPPTPKFTKGELLPFKEIKFAPGRSEPTNGAYVRLEKLAGLLTHNSNLVVEINVHLNHRYDKIAAEDLSVKRAVVIEQYFLGRSVNKNQFKVRGLGNSNPVNPKNLSDDDERVEVKVLDF